MLICLLKIYCTKTNDYLFAIMCKYDTIRERRYFKSDDAFLFKGGKNMESFGNKLRMVRKKFTLTQADLAKKVGVSTSTIGMYEQNRREPNFEILRKICDVLSTQADYFVGDQEITDNMMESSKRFIETTNNSILKVGDRTANEEQTQKARKIIIDAVEKALKNIYKMILDDGLR